jgi:hypothetical protein
MALYIGSSEKKKIYLDGALRRLNIFSTTPIINGTKLLSSDDLILKDSQGVYLTVLEEVTENPSTAKLGTASLGQMRLGIS